MRLLEQRRLAAIETETALLGNSLEGALALAMLGRRVEELQVMLERVAQDPEVLRVFIINNRGDVKVSSDSALINEHFSPGEGKCAHCHLQDTKEPSPATSAFSRGEESFWSARPIYNDEECQQCHANENQVNGMLVVERSLDEFYKEIDLEKKQLATLSIGGFAGAALILIPLLRILVIVRLKHLSRQASRIRGEDLDHPLKIKGHDEVSNLSDTLEEMRVRLKTSLQETQAGKAYLEEMMDGVHEGMLVIDRNLRITRVNRAWCELTGRSTDEVIGKHCVEICSQKDLTPNCCPAKECLKNAKEGWAIHAIPDKSGNIRHLEVHCSPIKNETGEITEVVEVTRDITKRIELESQLRHAERLTSVGRLAAGVAHEINNPMASIVACAEGLQRRFNQAKGGTPLPTEAEINNYLDTIRQAGRRCRDVTSKLLDFSRKNSEQKSLIDLNHLIEEAVSLVRNSVAEGCYIRTELDPELPALEGVPDELTQLIFNLLINAVDAVDGEGEILLSTHKHKNGIKFRIQDSGPGIPEADKDQIFDPFFTTKPPGVGSGLGLFVCKGIVNRHNGTLSVENAEKRGTVIQIYFPSASNGVGSSVDSS